MDPALQKVSVVCHAEGRVDTVLLSARSYMARNTRRNDDRIPPYAVDLAQFELLSFQVAAAPDDVTTRQQSAAVSVDTVLRFQRAARIARYSYAVHLVPELLTTVDFPEPRATTLFAYRDQAHEVRLLELSNLGAALLQRLMAGERLGGTARDSAREVGMPLNDALLGEISVLLDDLEERGAILTGAAT